MAYFKFCNVRKVKNERCTTFEALLITFIHTKCRYKTLHLQTKYPRAQKQTFASCAHSSIFIRKILDYQGKRCHYLFVCFTIHDITLSLTQLGTSFRTIEGTVNNWTFFSWRILALVERQAIFSHINDITDWNVYRHPNADEWMNI